MQNKIYLKLLFILVVFIVFLSACQPTPRNQIVVDKNNLEQEIKDKTVETAQIIVTESTDVTKADDTVTWKEQYIDDKGIFNVNIDALIILPEVTSFPVAKMVPAQISDDQLSKAVNTFLKDKTIYDGNIPLTKAELAQEIINAKAELQESGLKSDEQYIDYLEECYANAPESVELNQIQPIWKENPQGIKMVNIMAQADDGERTFMYAKTSETEKSYLEYKTNAEKYWIVETKSIKPNGTLISSLQAEQLALQVMEQLGMQDVQVVSKNIGSLILKNPSDLSDEKQCYIFFLSKTVNNIPFTYVSRAGGDYMFDEDPYAPPVAQETIEIHISDNGIVHFYWDNPYEITEYVSDNVALLSFDEIKNIFLNQMKIEGQGRNEWYGLNGIVNDRINVERVELGMMTTIDKDNPGEFLCIPVWDFFVTTEQTHSDNSVGTGEGNESNYSIITINAINGSIISRNLGY